MTDFQPQGQNWSEKNPVIGTGEGESPLANAPMAEVTMRTMSSDIASIKETGGGEPRPYNPQMQSVPVAAPVAQPIQAASTIVPPQTDIGGVAQVSLGAQPEMQAPKSKTNWFAILSVLIGIIAVGALGYFFVYPRFFATPAPVAAPVTQTTELPAVPAVATTTELATTTAATSTVTGPQYETVVSHVSLFKTSADTSSELTLAAVTLDAVKSGIKSNPVDVPLLKEIVFKNNLGKVYAMSAIAPLFMPTLFTASTTALFAPDATFFTYIDKTGVWPGMVLKLAGGADAAAAKAAIKTLETGNEFSSLFLTDPGTAGRWKDGKVSTFIARYVPFSTKGIAFSYAWLNNNLVISTSYAGAQAAAAKLGL